MRSLIAFLAAAFLVASPAGARPAFSQDELESMLAPVALYPDAVLDQILDAATHPADVVEAARTAAAPSPEWAPSVQVLVAYPEILQRMAESFAWMRDLGDAWRAQPQQVLETVRALRERAAAVGYGGEQPPSVVVEGGTVFLPYYDSGAVYGHWRSPSRPPVRWRPWGRRERHGFAPHERHPGRPGDRERRERPGYIEKDYRPVPESQRQPIINSAPRLGADRP